MQQNGNSVATPANLGKIYWGYCLVWTASKTKPALHQEPTKYMVDKREHYSLEYYALYELYADGTPNLYTSVVGSKAFWTKIFDNEKDCIEAYLADFESNFWQRQAYLEKLEKDNETKKEKILGEKSPFKKRLEELKSSVP